MIHPFYIYVLVVLNSDGKVDEVKPGICQDPEVRKSQIAKALRKTVILLCHRSIPGTGYGEWFPQVNGRRLEKQIKSRFKAYHKGGEFFAPDALNDILQFVASHPMRTARTVVACREECKFKSLFDRKSKVLHGDHFVFQDLLVT